MRSTGTRAGRVPTLAVLAIVLGILFFIPRATTNAARQERTEIRALWVLRTSLTSPQASTTLVRRRTRTDSTRCSSRCAAAATPTTAAALEPRATELQRQPLTFDPLATVLEQRARGGPARSRLGQCQPGVERGGPADRARTPRLPPSRMADGAARHRTGARAHRAATARPTSAGSRAGRARSSTRSKDCTRRRSMPEAGAARRIGRPRHRAPVRRSTASISITRATRPSGSITAAATHRASSARAIRPKLDAAMRRALDARERDRSASPTRRAAG